MFFYFFKKKTKECIKVFSICLPIKYHGESFFFPVKKQKLLMHKQKICLFLIKNLNSWPKCSQISFFMTRLRRLASMQLSSYLCFVLFLIRFENQVGQMPNTKRFTIFITVTVHMWKLICLQITDEPNQGGNYDFKFFQSMK